MSICTEYNPLAKARGLSFRMDAHGKQDLELTRACADPESFVRGGPNLIKFFFKIDVGIEDPNATINGPSSARQ